MGHVFDGKLRRTGLDVAPPYPYCCRYHGHDVVAPGIIFSLCVPGHRTDRATFKSTVVLQGPWPPAAAPGAIQVPPLVASDPLWTLSHLHCTWDHWLCLLCAWNLRILEQVHYGPSVCRRIECPQRRFFGIHEYTVDGEGGPAGFERGTPMIDDSRFGSARHSR